MSSSDIILRYRGSRELAILGVGEVKGPGDTLKVATRKQADRLLAFYDFVEVGPDGATEEEED